MKSLLRKTAFALNLLSLSVIILGSLALFVPSVTVAQATGGTFTPTLPQNIRQYTLLANLGQFTPGGTIDVQAGLSTYLINLYKMGIAIATGLALIMITFGGVKYVSTDAINGKSEGKDMIMNALQGLLLAFTSYILLNQLNPDLLNTGLNESIKAETINTTINSGPVLTTANDPANPANTTANGIKSIGDDLASIQAKLNDPNAQLTEEELEALQDRAIKDQKALDLMNSSTYKSGSIAALTQAGLSFPNKEWNDYALQQVKESGLLNLSPSDAAKYFPDGKPTAEGYVSLLASIAKSESNFNPADGKSMKQTDVGNTYSMGLLSLSPGDGVVKQFGFTTPELLTDPKNNIKAGTYILLNQVKNSGSITGGAGTNANGHYWGPLYRGE